MDAEEENAFPGFYSEDDDALYLQAYENFEAKEAGAHAEVVNQEEFVGSESQDRALHEACKAYEEGIAAPTSVHGSSPSSHHPRHIMTRSSQTAKAASPDQQSSTSSLPSVDQNGRTVPVQLPLGNTYLTVSNLVSQLWCEQEMVYKFWKPDITAAIESKPAVAAVAAAAKGGDKLHKKRDREVNRYVPVVTKTREDEYGIRLINTIQSLRGLLVIGDPCIREIAIFDTALIQNILVVGTVDELRFNGRDQLELVEFKTRGDISKPIGKAQMQAYKMQTMLYKQMLDDLTRGKVDSRLILEQQRLSPDLALNDELLKLVRGLGIGYNSAKTITLGKLMASALQQFQFLPSVQVLTLEIKSRDGRSDAIARETVDFDSEWLQQRLHHCLSFWLGERQVQGVDIEDTWKCRFCAFSDNCEWRLKMNDIYAGN